MVFVNVGSDGKSLPIKNVKRLNMLVCHSLYSNIYRPSAKRRLHEYHKANGNMLRFPTYSSNYQYQQIIKTSYDDYYDDEIDLQLSSIFLTIGIIGFLIYFLIKYLNKRKDK